MRTFTDICNDADRATMAATYILASGYDSSYATAAQVQAAKDNVLPNAEGKVKNSEYATWGNHVPITAEYYQEAFAEADIISLALGNTNFGTFIFNEITNATMNSDKPINFRVEAAIRTLSPEAQAKVLELRDKL